MNPTDTPQEWLLRPIPFAVTTFYFLLLIALVIVQAFIARARGNRPWWDVVTTSIVIVCAGVACYFGAFTLSYSNQYTASALFFDTNRVWLLAGSIIGIPLLVGALWGSVLILLRLHRTPVTAQRIVIVLRAGQPPEIRTENLREPPIVVVEPGGIVSTGLTPDVRLSSAPDPT